MSDSQETLIKKYIKASENYDTKKLDSYYRLDAIDARKTIIKAFSPFEKSQLWNKIKLCGKYVEPVMKSLNILDVFMRDDPDPIWINSKLNIIKKIDQIKVDEIINILNVINWCLSKNLLFNNDDIELNIVDILNLIIKHNPEHERLFVRYAIIMKMITLQSVVIVEKDRGIIHHGDLYHMVCEISSELRMDMSVLSSIMDDE